LGKKRGKKENFTDKKTMKLFKNYGKHYQSCPYCSTIQGTDFCNKTQCVPMVKCENGVNQWETSTNDIIN
jgi:translation initiation factor 2 beta subunit (eIF-2beta)/eIF-5